MKNIAAVLFLLSVCFFASAQKLDWNISYDYQFSNYEYDASHDRYDPSYTLHASRLTPEIGVIVKQDKNIFHRVRAGIDIFKDMGTGSQNLDLFHEILVYYDLEAAFSNGGSLEALAGIFPRRYTKGDYIGPFFDDDRYFTDNNLEGMLFKYSNKHIYAELGLDWLGKLGDKYTPLRRERFQVLTAGSWDFARTLSLDWTGSLYHFACSPLLPNVVDNGMVYPRIKWAPETALETLWIDAGGLFTYQNDRHTGAGPVFPMGFLSRQRIGKWHLSLDNRVYFGDDLMPLYDASYEGVPYASDLYFGDQAFHTLHGDPSWADFLSLVYEPRLTKWLSVCVRLTFKFGEPYKAIDVPVFRGWEQTASLKINFDALRQSPKAKTRRSLFEGLQRYAL